MYYTLLFYPKFSKKVEKEIMNFRIKYDPFVKSWKPHITLVFPVSDKDISEEDFIKHIITILNKWKPFDIHIKGFEKSWDHWLFVLLKEGNEKVIKLHDEFYTGILNSQLRKDIDYIPHLGIGLFVKNNSGYTLKNPKKVEFDKRTYEKAIVDIEKINIDHFDKINEFVIEILDNNYKVINSKIIKLQNS